MPTISAWSPVPAFVWREGFLLRALIIGGSVGFTLGMLAWLDSGFVVVGVIVLVVVGLFYGIWMARRMTRYWPESARLSGDDRAVVVRAARRGEPPAEQRLADGVASYARGLSAAAEDARLLRWVVVVVLVAGVGSALFDAFYGSWGNLVVSVVYLAALLVELFWWPQRQAALLANAHRAAQA